MQTDAIIKRMSQIKQ